MPSPANGRLERVAVRAELEPKLRLYRRLWISGNDLREAKAAIDEVLNSKLLYPRRKEPNALLTALTTALVVSYARPFVNSRGQSAIAERTVPGSLLRVLTARERELHDALWEIVRSTKSALVEKVSPAERAQPAQPWTRVNNCTDRALLLQRCGLESETDPRQRLTALTRLPRLIDGLWKDAHPTAAPEGL